MGAMASQITSLMIICSTVHSGADQRIYRSSASLAFVWGIHLSPVNSSHKGPVTRKMLPFDDVIVQRFHVRVPDPQKSCNDLTQTNKGHHHNRSNEGPKVIWLLVHFLPVYFVNVFTCLMYIPSEFLATVEQANNLLEIGLDMISWYIMITLRFSSNYASKLCMSAPETEYLSLPETMLSHYKLDYREQMSVMFLTKHATYIWKYHLSERYP